MRNPIITVYVNELSDTVVNDVYQYDHGIKQDIRGIDTAKVLEAHFGIDGQKNTVQGIVTTSDKGHIVEIPDFILAQPRQVWVYLYLEEENSGYTRYVVRIPPKPRGKPSEFAPTQTQIDNYNQLVAELNGIIAEFPQLSDTNDEIHVLETSDIDVTLSVKGKAADAEATGKRIDDLSKKVATAIGGVKGHPEIIAAEFQEIAADETVSQEEDIRLNRFNSYDFYCRFNGAFDSVTVGHGGSGSNTYNSAAKVDATKIYIMQGAANTVIYEYTHGLTISGFLQVLVTTNDWGRASVRLATTSGVFETPENLIGNNVWSGCGAGSVYAKVTQDCYDCRLVWDLAALRKDVYLFGDSYTPMHDPSSWPYQLAMLGYDGFMVCGTPGATAESAYTQFERIMAIRHPQLCIWALGMNNSEASTNKYESWLQYTLNVVEYCDTHGIELVLATIPNCPNMLNVTKNDWVRSSGKRYLDFARAVGAETEASAWYDGMLKADGIHPTALGAKVLAQRALLDVPELGNLS